MSYSYQIAKEVLNDNDKNRLMCLYLNCEPTSINWEKATEAFGAKSVDSMRVMTRTTLKKIENAGGKEGVDVATPAKGKGKKRKASDNEDSTPATKKRGWPAKKSAAPVAEEADEDDDTAEVKVKPEPDVEENAEVGDED